MFNIYTNESEKNVAQRELSYEELNENLETICLSHINKNEAFAFVFLLYRNRNYAMIKVLGDSDYWNLLDDIAMNFLTVFSLNCTNINGVHLNVPHRRMDNCPWGDVENSSSEETNILDYLHLKEKIDLPAFCFFTISKEGNITDCFVKVIQSKEINAVKNEIETILTNVVESLSRITPENKFNAEQILRIVKGSAVANPLESVAKWDWKRVLIPALWGIIKICLR